MSRHHDTIAALATPAGTSAIAIVRASGPDSERLTREIFGETPQPRTLRHGDYRDRAGGLVDDVMFVRFRGPQAYAGEDALEIYCHGNPFIAQRILEDLLARGARAAGPGEFTQRAFLNGRMDLSQAEAVMDLIHARSDRALAAANQQLRGALGRRMGELVDELLGLSARIEAYIDFPEEDLPREDRALAGEMISRILLETNMLIATSRYGDLLRDGVKTVIIGPPNAGKSSLFNRLAGRDRALVSEEPGTTRDFLEERIVVGPHCLRLIDTAGLNPVPGRLEKLGIEKTLERLEEADVAIWLFDATQSAPTLPPPLAASIRSESAIVAANKADLLQSELDVSLRAFAPMLVSALTGRGLAELEAAIVNKADRIRPEGADAIVINARHAQALQSVRECLTTAGDQLDSGEPMELLASNLRGAIGGLEEICGKIDNERMLDRLFATFCIGK